MAYLVESRIESNSTSGNCVASRDGEIGWRRVAAHPKNPKV